MYKELLYITLNENEIIYYISQPPHSVFGSNHVPSKGQPSLILVTTQSATSEANSLPRPRKRATCLLNREGRAGYRFTVMKKTNGTPTFPTGKNCLWKFM